MVRHTPKLAQHLQHLRQVAAELPETAAASMERSAQEGLRQGLDPYGNPHPRTGEGKPFDPQGHVRAGWHGVVVAGEAVLLGTHRACGWLGRRWKGRPARLQRPREGGGLGTWLQPLTHAVADRIAKVPRV